MIYQWNLSKWLEGVVCDAVLKVESLADDLRREGLAFESLPSENASYRVRPWQEFFDDELLDLVRGWAAEECEQFGYDWPAVTGA